ncbi:hypothetical protein [Kordia jejudonensis]|nr:hypothetical protein [Kordia jejudonensis]
MMHYLAGENVAGAKTVFEDMKILFSKSARTADDDTQENMT